MDHPSTENLFSILCCNTEIDIFTWNSPSIEITEGRMERAYLHIDVDHPGNNSYFCLHCGDPFPNLIRAFEHGQRLHPRKRPLQLLLKDTRGNAPTGKQRQLKNN